MSIYPSVFEYLDPTDQQKIDMAGARAAALEYAEALDAVLPNGPDKTYIMRKLRELAMWANVAIARQPAGSPRE